jgi:hypothetical protein
LKPIKILEAMEKIGKRKEAGWKFRIFKERSKKRNKSLKEKTIEDYIKKGTKECHRHKHTFSKKNIIRENKRKKKERNTRFRQESYTGNHGYTFKQDRKHKVE